MEIALALIVKRSLNGLMKNLFALVAKKSIA